MKALRIIAGLLFATYVELSTAAPASNATRAIPPIVTLDNGTFIGLNTGLVNSWLGIPFAKPPVGNLRFAKPVANDPYNGTTSALAFGLACPQQSITLPLISGLPADAVNFITNSIYGILFPDSEDCLTINVVAPATATSSSKLPVLAWIFGGGFELGSPSIYSGQTIVQESIALGQPVVYVSMNYRLSAFGFLASQEVKDAGVGNLGLRDQRQALRWVQKYISAFGGDPTKVTIWGESAGAISVATQMLVNGGDTEGLFRAAFMESGSPLPVGDITNGQKYYDAIVADTGCSGAYDTLQCLREVPYATLKTAMDNTPNVFSYQSLDLAWLPRTDGDFIAAPAQQLVLQGSVANIPFVTGDCDDEATLFSLSNANVTTDAEVATYISTFYFPTGSAAEVNQILSAYPSDPSDGSPFDTGTLNAITPQFKRLAAIQGDIVFQAPRRFFLQQRSGKQKTWSFVSKRLKTLPVLGSAHATDILNVYGPSQMTDYLIHFATNLDPNGVGLPNWPQYSNSSPTLLTFLDGLIPVSTEQDTYRVDAFNVLTNLSLAHPI